MFCNAAAGLFTIMDASPCAPANNDCGLIGARDIGCSIAATGEPTPRATGVRLLAPASNPTRLPVRLRFQLAASTPVRLEVYDASGRRIANIANRVFEFGPHEVSWSGRLDDGRMASAGVYIVTLFAGSARESQQLVVIK